MKKFILFILVVCCSSQLYAQNRDYKKYDKAIKYYQNNEFEKSKKTLVKMIEKNSAWKKPFLLLSNIYLKESDYYKSAKTLLNIYDLENPDDILGIEQIANNFYFNGFYSEALYYYNTSCKLDSIYCDSKLKSFIDNCNFSIGAVSSPVDFEPVNLGEKINTNMSEIGPAITSDNSMLVFTRRVEYEGKEPQEDFYYSLNVDDKWQEAISFPSPLNTNDNEGALSFSNNQTFLIYTACNRSGGFGSCDLYYGINDLNNLNFFNLGGKVNSRYWDSQACFSSDRRYIYFVSNRPGGYGGTDIWITEILKDGFSEAFNAGPVINTSKDEMSPFLHPDNLSLYFSSKGHVGMGDFDLFLSTRESVGDQWRSVRNLGYPINNHKSQNSLVVSSDGKTAFYNSSDNGFGSDDIFCFELPENIQANEVKDLELDIILSKIGEEIVLENVHFLNNSFILNNDSLSELNSLAEYLIKTDIRVVIEGHTDSNGDEYSNQVLSERRAKSVYDYLLKVGVSPDQLLYEGYGYSRPIADNSNEKGRALNRRTSFVILE
ncbi:MAG: OmpA family protein [Flavobacteriales bacterium]|nr:OmpA family protein [Flavobacteriales bacterium]